MNYNQITIPSRSILLLYTRILKKHSHGQVISIPSILWTVYLGPATSRSFSAALQPAPARNSSFLHGRAWPQQELPPGATMHTDESTQMTGFCQQARGAPVTQSLAPIHCGDSLCSQPKASWCAARGHGLPLLFPTWSIDLCRPGDTKKGGSGSTLRSL